MCDCRLCAPPDGWGRLGFCDDKTQRTISIRVPGAGSARNLSGRSTGARAGDKRAGCGRCSCRRCSGDRVRGASTIPDPYVSQLFVQRLRSVSARHFPVKGRPGSGHELTAGVEAGYEWLHEATRVRLWHERCEYNRALCPGRDATGRHDVLPLPMHRVLSACGPCSGIDSDIKAPWQSAGHLFVFGPGISVCRVDDCCLRMVPAAIWSDGCATDGELQPAERCGIQCSSGVSPGTGSLVDASVAL